MATQYSNKPIVTNGLVYALDFGNQKSYVSGSSSGRSLRFFPTTSSFAYYGGLSTIPNLVNGLLQLSGSGTTTGSQLVTNTQFSDLVPAGDFTIQVVVNNKGEGIFITQGPSDTRLISTLNTSGTVLGWYINPLPYAQAGGSGGNYYNKSYPLSSRLQHLTYRYSSGSYDLFVNGIPVSPSGRYSNITTNSGNLTINGAQSNGFSNTDLGNFYIYSRALTSDEIYSNYLIQAQRYGLPTIPKPYTLDENAFLFLSQSGITDPIITSSINTFVLGLKSASLWDKMIAIYPFVGTGSVGVNLTGSQSWNLKEPTSAFYRLAFTGSWNGSTSGSTPSGSNTSINTGVLPYEYYPFKSDSNQHISILSYDTPTSSSFLAGTGIDTETAVSTLAGDYGTPAAAYSVRKVRTAYSGALMDVRRDYDNTTGSIGYVSNGDLDTGSLLDFVVAGRAVLPGAYSGLAAAYSLRKVSGSYTGSAIDVRRSYDNTTGSIGFDSNGNLDTASLFNFVSRGDNFVLYSEEFDNAYWTLFPTGVTTVTANTFLAPDGTMTADTVVLPGAGRQLSRNSPTVPPTSSFSMFVSGAAGSILSIGNHNYSGIGTVLQSYTLGNGWTRISASFSGSTDEIRIVNQTATSYTFYIWGAQLNSGSVALPYVKTVASTKTNESGSFDTVSTGWVAQWYDQSGNNRHATQTVTGSQPLIVSSGSLVTENGKPAVQFDLNSFIPTPIPINTAMPLDVFATVKVDTVGSTGTWYVGFTGTDLSKYMITQRSVANGGIQSNLTTGSNVGVGEVKSNTTNTSSMYLHTTLYNVPTMSMYINNQLIGTSSAVDGNYYNASQTITIGSGRAAFRGNFKYGELLLYTSSQAANRPLIENNINNYYSIYTGSNNGFVARWYDQSGNNNHASQTTASSQPLIVLSGSVVSSGTRPSLLWGSDGLTNLGFSRISNIQTVFHISQLLTTTSQSFLLGDTVTFDYHAGTGDPQTWFSSNPPVEIRSSSNNYINGIQRDLDYFSTYYRNLDRNLITLIHTSAIGRANTISQDRAILGRSWRGYIQEITLYTGSQVSNRPAIEYGINNYYNIYPQTSSFTTSSFTIKATPTGITGAINNQPLNGISSTGPVGFITVSRTGSNALTIARNGVTSSFTVPASGALSTGIYLGASNYNGIAVGSSPLGISFASVGVGLTNSETQILNNLVGSLQLNLRRVADADAYAFLAAANITGIPEQIAINTLVTDLKSYGVWTKLKAIYPFVGGTASTHKFNLKDPRDTDSAFRLTFSGSWTHSSTGAQPNGAAGTYADTKLNLNTHLVPTSAHYMGYARTDNSGERFLMGIYAGASGDTFLDFYGSLRLFYGLASAGADISIPSWKGLWHLNALGSSTVLYRNGTSLNTTTRNGILPSQNLFLGAGNNGSGGSTYNSIQELAFASIGDGLTSTEAANIYTAVQAFQTTLGRQV